MTYRRFFLLFSVFFICNFSVLGSCYGYDPQFFDEEDVSVCLNNDTLLVFEFAHNSKGHQSAAVYDHYLITIPNKLGSISMYDMKNKQRVYTCLLSPLEGTDPYGNTRFHCNQCTFSNTKYKESDMFPLLYISQRADSLYRCSVLVYRLVEQWNEENKISSFEAQLVQTIFFPQMTKDNALGNVNAAYSSSENLFFLYSRNNNRKDSNYRKCRISKVKIPQIKANTVFLSDDDIIDPFDIDCSALNMQGGAIYNNKLYIAQGYYKSGEINLRVIDLEHKKLEKTYDLLSQGVSWEPEGCFFYEGNLYLSSSKYIFQIEMNQK